MDDDLLQEAQRKKPRRLRWTGAVAAVLAIGILVSAILSPESSPLVTSAHAIAQAEYPEMTKLPDAAQFEENGEYNKAFDEWMDAWRAQGTYAERYARDDFRDFLTRSIPQFLSEANGENLVYSPLNLYMALAMLAEVTDGESRAQLLSLLGTENIETLRSRANALWNANYRNDGANFSLLANSLWLDTDTAYVQETVERLAENYFASSYRGEMGSEEYNQMLQDWLNEQTGGLLRDQIDGIEMKEWTVLALASTVYFAGKWNQKFDAEKTAPQSFYGANGETTCDFLHNSVTGNYYWGEGFGAIRIPFAEVGAMWIILPDEGCSPEALLADGEYLELLLSGESWEKRKGVLLHESIPKFDVSSQLDLQSGLEALGVTGVFDETASDFTPLTAIENLYLSKILHGARVSIDENGCTAASYVTAMVEATGGMPAEDEVDFVADRPFLFAITGMDGLPLFIGVVNNPA